jgi:hypothetical protein
MESIGAHFRALCSAPLVGNHGRGAVQNHEKPWFLNDLRRLSLGCFGSSRVRVVGSWVSCGFPVGLLWACRSLVCLLSAGGSLVSFR